MTLQNPIAIKDFFYTDLEKELYYFLWNSKIHKIKKKNNNSWLYLWWFEDDEHYWIYTCIKIWLDKKRLLKQKTNWISLLEAEMKTKVIDLCARGIDFISIFSKKKLVTYFGKMC